MVALPEIPSALRDNWRGWWPGPGSVDAIAADIVARLATAVQAWDLDDLSLLPGGNVALVLAVRRGGCDAVLKLSPGVEPGPLRREGAALARWATRALAPRVLETRDDGLTLLLARVRPGTSLRDAGADGAQIIATIGALCPGLHLDLGTDSGFPTLAAYAELEGWLAALAGRREHDELVRLLAPSPEDRLLHTDLHWLNVLRDGDRWIVIDPKPHIGDPHAETFAFFDGPPLRDLPRSSGRAREAVRRLSDAYAHAAGLDGDRLRAWVRLRAVSIAGQPGMAATEKGARLARLAEALA